MLCRKPAIRLLVARRVSFLLTTVVEDEQVRQTLDDFLLPLLQQAMVHAFPKALHKASKQEDVLENLHRLVMPPNCERRMQGVFASMMGTETFVANFVDAQRKVLRMDFAKDQVSGRAERSGSWTRGRGRVGEDEARDSSTGGTPGGNENEGKRSSRSRPTTGRDHPARRETGTTGTGSPAPRPTWSPASGGAPASPASSSPRDESGGGSSPSPRSAGPSEEEFAGGGSPARRSRGSLIGQPGFEEQLKQWTKKCLQTAIEAYKVRCGGMEDFLLDEDDGMPDVSDVGDVADEAYDGSPRGSSPRGSSPRPSSEASSSSAPPPAFASTFSLGPGPESNQKLVRQFSSGSSVDARGSRARTSSVTIGYQIETAAPPPMVVPGLFERPPPQRSSTATSASSAVFFVSPKKSRHQRVLELDLKEEISDIFIEALNNRETRRRLTRGAMNAIREGMREAVMAPGPAGIESEALAAMRPGECGSSPDDDPAINYRGREIKTYLLSLLRDQDFAAAALEGGLPEIKQGMRDIATDPGIAEAVKNLLLSIMADEEVHRAMMKGVWGGFKSRLTQGLG